MRKSLKYRLTRHLVDLGTFRIQPMRIVDGGAWGAEHLWDIYDEQLHLIGFEPDVEEYKRLNQVAKNASLAQKKEYHPVALYRDKGIYTLRISKNRVASSLLQTNWDFVYRFPHAEPGAIIASAQVQTTDLDSFLRENGIDYVDFMKVDAESAELAVLEGANQVLSDSLLGLSVEVFFQPYHIGRPLFADIDQYLRRFGFVLFDLQPERWRRKTLTTNDLTTWYGAGQLIWAQALYFRDLAAEMMSARYEQNANERIKVLKLASLAELLNFPDFAIELLLNAKNVGLLDEEDVELMVTLLTPSREGHQYLRHIGMVKRVARSFIPPFCRRALRRLLESILSS